MATWDHLPVDVAGSICALNGVHFLLTKLRFVSKQGNALSKYAPIFKRAYAVEWNYDEKDLDPNGEWMQVSLERYRYQAIQFHSLDKTFAARFDRLFGQARASDNPEAIRQLGETLEVVVEQISWRTRAETRLTAWAEQSLLGLGLKNLAPSYLFSEWLRECPRSYLVQTRAVPREGSQDPPAVDITAHFVVYGYNGLPIPFSYHQLAVGGAGIFPHGEAFDLWTADTPLISSAKKMCTPMKEDEVEVNNDQWEMANYDTAPFCNQEAFLRLREAILGPERAPDFEQFVLAEWLFIHGFTAFDSLHLYQERGMSWELLEDSTRSVAFRAVVFLLDKSHQAYPKPSKLPLRVPERPDPINTSKLEQLTKLLRYGQTAADGRAERFEPFKFCGMAVFEDGSRFQPSDREIADPEIAVRGGDYQKKRYAVGKSLSTVAKTFDERIRRGIIEHRQVRNILAPLSDFTAGVQYQGQLGQRMAQWFDWVSSHCSGAPKGLQQLKAWLEAADVAVLPLPNTAVVRNFLTSDDTQTTGVLCIVTPDGEVVKIWFSGVVKSETSLNSFELAVNGTVIFNNTFNKAGSAFDPVSAVDESILVSSDLHQKVVNWLFNGRTTPGEISGEVVLSFLVNLAGGAQYPTNLWDLRHLLAPPPQLPPHPGLPEMRPMVFPGASKGGGGFQFGVTFPNFAFNPFNSKGAPPAASAAEDPSKPPMVLTPMPPPATSGPAYGGGALFTQTQGNFHFFDSATILLDASVWPPAVTFTGLNGRDLCLDRDTGRLALRLSRRTTLSHHTHSTAMQFAQFRNFPTRLGVQNIEPVFDVPEAEYQQLNHTFHPTGFLDNRLVIRFTSGQLHSQSIKIEAKPGTFVDLDGRDESAEIQSGDEISANVSTGGFGSLRYSAVIDLPLVDRKGAPHEFSNLCPQALYHSGVVYAMAKGSRKLERIEVIDEKTDQPVAILLIHRSMLSFGASAGPVDQDVPVLFQGRLFGVGHELFELVWSDTRPLTLVRRVHATASNRLDPRLVNLGDKAIVVCQVNHDVFPEPMLVAPGPLGTAPEEGTKFIPLSTSLKRVTTYFYSPVIDSLVGVETLPASTKVEVLAAVPFPPPPHRPSPICSRCKTVLVKPVHAFDVPLRLNKIKQVQICDQCMGNLTEDSMALRDWYEPDLPEPDPDPVELPTGVSRLHTWPVATLLELPFRPISELMIEPLLTLVTLPGLSSFFMHPI